MRIQANEQYCGIRFVKLRQALKRLPELWRTDLLADVFDNGPKAAIQLASQMHRDGYIEQAKSGESGWWLLTEKGHALSHATAAALLRRRTGEEAVARFLERVAAVNAEDGHHYYVSRVILFGSMLGREERVSDVDLMVKLERKQRFCDMSGEDYVQACYARVEQCGRRLSSFEEHLKWPYVEVLLRLKARSRAISLTAWNEEWITTKPHRIIFDIGNPRAEFF